MATQTLSVSPLPAIPEVIHEAVRREICRMNTAICQATQNSPIKVSLTWRPNPRFAQQLSEEVENCFSQQLASQMIEDLDHGTPPGGTLAIGYASAPDLAPDTKLIIPLARYVNETIERLEATLAAFKSAAAEIG